MGEAMTVLSIQPRLRTNSIHGLPHAFAEWVALTKFLHGARGVGRWFDRVVSATAGHADQAPSSSPLPPTLPASAVVVWTESSPRSATMSAGQS